MWLLGHRVARLWESRGKAGDRPGDCAAWPEGATLSGARRTELGGNRVAESQDALNLEPPERAAGTLVLGSRPSRGSRRSVWEAVTLVQAWAEGGSHFLQQRRPGSGAEPRTRQSGFDLGHSCPVELAARERALRLHRPTWYHRPHVALEHLRGCERD